MRIGELAREVGVSTDTIRFYERSGHLPRADRRDNNYREYAQAEVEHLRLLIDLRQMGVSLEVASEMAGWCHSGHCGNTSSALPHVINARRRELAGQVARLQALDARLADLESHLSVGGGALALIVSGGPCCEAAGSVMGVAEGGCACCAPPAVPS